MVAGRVLIRVVHRALEHGAVHGPCATLVAASGDDYSVATFEAVAMALQSTLGDGNTGGKGRVSAGGAEATG